MWIKICGSTSFEDAQMAADYGADALGFVFAPSPRRVEPDVVRDITAKLPPQVETYGVFVDPSFEQIAATVTACGLSGVQLHRSADVRLPWRLRQRFPHLRILGVVRCGNPAHEFEHQLSALSQDECLHAILVDSSSPRALGGSGTSFDWVQARSSLERVAPRRVIAAGGLSPQNVAQAISILRPWGVDVVSGVESIPGRKDPSRVRDFIQAARQAAQELVEAR